MQDGLPRKRLAVLIDGENVSHRLAEDVFKAVRRFGEPAVRRVYGDFKGPASSWSEAAAHHMLEPRHCFAPTTGKNGADILLAIDAMRLLLAGGLDGFCIVSSDGDFSELAVSIRAEGCRAYGFGREAVKERRRLAFDEYVVIASAPAVKGVAVRPHAALPALRSALDKTASRDGWYCLGAFGIQAQQGGIEPKRHGSRSLSALLRATGQFEVETGTPPGRFRPATLRAVGEA